MNEWRGIIPLFKPKGFTSHDCVNKVRRILKTKRVGHTGTLDPSVTGVLPICIGQATRLVEYIQELPKEYQATLSIGQSTSTEDADGEVIDVKAVHPQLSKEQVISALNSFIGEISQIPPMYSAVKVNGVRLHQLAREGKEIERAPRKVEIYKIDIHDLSLEQDFPEVSFRVKCSKGTYIRTLCVDIGKKLGYPAHMSFLQRVSSGPFRLDDCVTFEDLERAVENGTIASILRPLDHGVSQFPAYSVSKEDEKSVFDGKRLRLNTELKEDNLCRIYGPKGNFIAIYRAYLYNGVVWGKPEKVFHWEGE